MRILKVIHGYPPKYNCGSEIYTQTLCRGLSKRHEVRVFTRKEDPYQCEYSMSMEFDGLCPAIKIHVVNVPLSKDRYRREGIDQRFADALADYVPDVVHIGHLNHLSTSLVFKAASRGIPVVFTLHDYWLMCPRGQFIQMNPEDGSQLWQPCEGQEDRKCAEKCYARYFSGAQEDRKTDTEYWKGWVSRRMKHIHEVIECVDLFIAPSRHLHNKFLKDFGIPAVKIMYLDYGFELDRLEGRSRNHSEPFTFGYIGSHTPAKGIQYLVQAFAGLSDGALLRIWGRPRAENTGSLESMVNALPTDVSQRVEWLPEYGNENIVENVFNNVDAIVIPSIWEENSPLVIHEALQSGVPVITSDCGGMSEYIEHEVNGLLFKHRDVGSLTVQMQRFVDNPVYARQLVGRSYIQSETGGITNIERHVQAIESLYEKVIKRKNCNRVDKRKGPWRITFDTNPDDCNLHCIICEEHSLHSTLRQARRVSGEPRRVMPVELMRRTLIEAAAHGLREIIPSTMGEPLLYEHFDEFPELCKVHGLKLNLTTNGTFPYRGAQAWAEAIVPIGSDVKISINGARPETHERIMRGSRLEVTLENTRLFISVRDRLASEGGNYCSVTFQVTYLDNNIDELPDLVRLAAELGVDRLKGHHVWTHGFAELEQVSVRRNIRSIRHYNEVVKAIHQAAKEYRLTDGRQVRLDNLFPTPEDEIPDVAPGGECPFLGQEAWINWEGRFDPCCAPDKQRQSLGSFGSVQEKGLMAIWQSEQYRRLCVEYPSQPLCRSCNMREPNAGGQA